MARKKCKTCLQCFSYFWVDGIRYYHCWLCNETWKGKDDSLELCEDPRKTINVLVEEKEQNEE